MWLMPLADPRHMAGSWILCFAATPETNKSTLETVYVQNSHLHVMTDYVTLTTCQLVSFTDIFPTYSPLDLYSLFVLKWRHKLWSKRGMFPVFWWKLKWLNKKERVNLRVSTLNVFGQWKVIRILLGTCTEKLNNSINLSGSIKG